MLVDERDAGTRPRVLFYLEHAIQDAGLTRAGRAPRRLQADALRRDGRRRDDRATFTTRPISTTGRWPSDEPGRSGDSRPARVRLDHRELEQKAQGYAIANVVPEHLAEVRGREARTDRQDGGRGEGSADEGNHATGTTAPSNSSFRSRPAKPNARLNSERSPQARRLPAGATAKAAGRVEARSADLAAAACGAGRSAGRADGLDREHDRDRRDCRATRRRTRRPAPRGPVPIIMEVERGLGFEPTDREFEKLGYDIESRVPGTGKLRFIEVKGARLDGRNHHRDAQRDSLLLNKPDDFILAIVEFLTDTLTGSTTCADRFSESLISA